MKRRAFWHDYRSRCIYMITINAAPGIPRFSSIEKHANGYHVITSPTGDTIKTRLAEIPEH
ncbi:MAG: hypothetical protein U0L83_04930 [Muribaculaceae bacterium]|nr:hypothetical protein [Muribaculaceae bacterium]